MKSLLKALVVACGLMASASFAHASSLVGSNFQPQMTSTPVYVSPGGLQLTYAPNAQVQVTNTGLHFTATPDNNPNGYTNGSTLNGTGSLAGFGSGSAVFNDFSFGAGAGPQTLFVAKSGDGTQRITFVVTSYQVVNGKYYFYGNLNTEQVTCPAGNDPLACTQVAGTSVTTTGAVLKFTANGDLNGSPDGFSGTLAVTPEPSSLILLGTGLISAAAMVTRRRRSRSVLA